MPLHKILQLPHSDSTVAIAVQLVPKHPQLEYIFERLRNLCTALGTGNFFRFFLFFCSELHLEAFRASSITSTSTLAAAIPLSATTRNVESSVSALPSLCPCRCCPRAAAAAKSA